MANDYFQFKQFCVSQSKCAMKVGTDGVLLGAWAHGGNSVLDIGTGTGLIALMMAQRFPDAQIVGVDIDAAACEQARENIAASPFRVKIEEGNVIDLAGQYDCIVSNPPFFENSLECPDDGRTKARHTSSLSYRQLMESVSRLLSEQGEFSIVIPAECKSRIEEEAVYAGFFKVRECGIKTTARKPVRRYLIAFQKHPVTVPDFSSEILMDGNGERSQWYSKLTEQFYLK